MEVLTPVKLLYKPKPTDNTARIRKITAVLRDPLTIDGVILTCNHCHTRGMIDDHLKCLSCGNTVESDDAYYEGEKWTDEATMRNI